MAEIKFLLSAGGNLDVKGAGGAVLGGLGLDDCGLLLLLLGVLVVLL